MSQERIDKKRKIIKMPSRFNEDIYVAKNLNVEVNCEKYYKPQNFFVKAWRFFICFLIAKPIFYVYNKLFLGVKVTGKDNLKQLKTGGVCVCNHVHYMDWSFTPTFISKRRKTVTITLKNNFRIPVVRKLLAWYGCIPIADTISGSRKFYSHIEDNLKSGKIVHVFSEESLWPYYTKLRPFAKGAFYFACKHNYPIIPYVIVFRQSKGLARLIRRAPRISIVIGKLQQPNNKLKGREQIEELQERVRGIMKNLLEENPSYEFYNYIPEDKWEETLKKS